MTLTVHKKQAQSGEADSLVIFLHGYGADGRDLLGLADPLAEHLPNTTFVSPDAPFPCVVNPAGFQWFPISYIDGSSKEEMEQGIEKAVDHLGTFLDEIAVETGIPASRTVLLGFSQGTMMSLHLGPRRAEKYASIVGFSGRLLYHEDPNGEIQHKPDVLLIHGDQDDVVPYTEMANAANTMTADGFKVYTHTSKGTAHGIAPDGLGQALGFIKMSLGE